MEPNDIPWDIYVDERKGVDNHSLGFLAVPNTASFAHKLFKCRHHKPNVEGRTTESREIHWTDLHRGLIHTARNWIDTFFQHRGAKFYLLPWPKADTKEIVILRFLTRFCRVKELDAPYNIVVILDYDSEHAQAKIQNKVRKLGRIARCYHLDSMKNDCIQCCDLLLGCVSFLRENENAADMHDAFYDRWQQGEEGGKLRNAEAKRFIASYFAKKNVETDIKRAYDLTRRPK